MRASPCLFQEARESAIWMKIQFVSHEARTRQDLHSVLTSGSLALLKKRKEPETGCGAGQKGVRIIGGDCLASPDMRDAGTVPRHLL